LTSPDQIKRGGGYRVKSIVVTDNWDDYGGQESTYGNKYYYKMLDGTSSGVASYEPSIGGDEIALKKPHYYSSSDNLLYNDPAFYYRAYRFYQWQHGCCCYFILRVAGIIY
jgi:hypothetical protein